MMIYCVGYILQLLLVGLLMIVGHLCQSIIPLFVIAIIVFFDILVVISNLLDKNLFKFKNKQLIYNGKKVFLKDFFTGTILKKELDGYDGTFLSEGLEYNQIKDNLYKIYDRIVCPYIQVIKENNIVAKYGNFVSIDKGLNYGIKKDVIPVICSCFKDLNWQTYIKDVLMENLNSICDLSKDDLNLLELSLQKPCKYIELDEHIKGTHKDLKYEILEGEFGYYGTSPEDGENFKQKIFKGIVVLIETKKIASSEIIILPSSCMIIPMNNNFKKINLEDVVFNRKYSVYAKDEVEARYILTTSFIERLNNLQTVFAVKTLRCVIFRNKIMFCFDTSGKDFFEPISTIKDNILTLKPVHENLDNAYLNFFPFFEQLLEVIKIIEYLKLNQDIGL